MDDSMVNSDSVYWDSVVIETARKHPLTMALWLIADAAVNALIGAQDSIEAKLRNAAEEGTRSEAMNQVSECTPR